MSQRRLSNRTSAVTKRRLLEEKVEKRKVEAEIRIQKLKSRNLQNLHDQELQSFTEEAKRLSQIVDTNFLLSSDSENNSGNQSLDWDSNEEATSPSFIKDTRESDVAVDEIIQNIQNLDSQLVTEQPRDKVKRKKTSTDNEFLEGPA